MCLLPARQAAAFLLIAKSQLQPSLYALPTKWGSGKSAPHGFTSRLTGEPQTLLCRSWETTGLRPPFFPASLTKGVHCDDETPTLSLTQSATGSPLGGSGASG